MRSYDLLCLLWAWLLPAVGVLADESSHTNNFALRQGDTVVFLGDSVTAAGTYVKLVEHYTLLRFPDRKVRFINEGRISEDFDARAVGSLLGDSGCQSREGAPSVGLHGSRHQDRPAADRVFTAGCRRAPQLRPVLRAPLPLCSHAGRMEPLLAGGQGLARGAV